MLFSESGNVRSSKLPMNHVTYKMVRFVDYFVWNLTAVIMLLTYDRRIYKQRYEENS